jgi:hypothetical protein
MGAGRKEVPRVIRGYDLFRLNEAELSNRLSLNYYPTHHFKNVDYIEDNNFFAYIYPQMEKHDYLDDYLENVRLLKKVDACQYGHTSEQVLTLLTITNKERGICALKAFYDNDNKF